MVLIIIIVPCLLAIDIYRLTYWSIDYIIKYKVIFRNNLLENTRIQRFITIYQSSSIFYFIAGVRMSIGFIPLIISLTGNLNFNDILACIFLYTLYSCLVLGNSVPVVSTILTTTITDLAKLYRTPYILLCFDIIPYAIFKFF